LAEYLELADLTLYLTNIINKELFLNDDLTIKILEVRNVFAISDKHFNLKKKCSRAIK
jgi:hypothetical protein